MGKQNRSPRFKPSKIDEFMAALSAGEMALPFPAEDMMRYARTEEKRAKLTKEVIRWRKDNQTMLRLLTKAKVFVLEKEPWTLDEKHREKEVWATCSALSESGLLQPPFGSMWVEQEIDGVGEKDIHNVKRVDAACVVFLDRLKTNPQDDEAEKQVKLDIIDQSGLPDGHVMVIKTYFRTWTGGKTYWMDTLATTVPCFANKDDVYAVFSVQSYPALLEADRMLAEILLDGEGKRTLEEQSTIKGVKMLSRLLAALNTSWVDKKDMKQDHPVLMPVVETDSKGRKKRRLKNIANLTPYTKVSSFHESAMRRSEGSDRKKSIPHIRRGHVHRYWKGPRNDLDKRKLVAKFVEATWVNKEPDSPDVQDMEKRYKVSV